jgi:hypothetical protein
MQNSKNRIYRTAKTEYISGLDNSLCCVKQMNEY